jgi:DNA-binding Lrp family transcriptional regulator
VFSNKEEPDNINENVNQVIDYQLIDEIDQKLIELILKGYSNKKIALEAMSPLSTVQRRIRKIFENQYVQKKSELNHKRLGLRKCYLSISLTGGHSNVVVKKVSAMRGITSVSSVLGSVDIMSTCLFRETTDLFKIIESIKTIERVDKVSWVEEVHNVPSKEIMIFSSLLQESIKTNVQENNSSHSPKETAP